ncbi:Pas5 [Actinoplanes phage phiAsp2]|uniref:Pas5 n=1 Tax=Actinoplanes phage phiAsp2 TaxID=279303 RepID=Q6J826_9CAUD|nr:Pas5 [Actinoplanes phage phiAsp2]AAT36753.1 Pas5 [Actinoplanes phage phiAsp2]
MIIDRATIATGAALIGLSVAYLVLGLVW